MVLLYVCCGQTSKSEFILWISNGESQSGYKIINYNNIDLIFIKFSFLVSNRNIILQRKRVYQGN